MKSDRSGARDMTDTKINLQESYLEQAKKDQAMLSIYLVNGVQLKGQVKAYDNFTVLLVNNGHEQLVYKHAISTVQR